MRIRIRTKWLGEAKFNLTDRKYSKTRAQCLHQEHGSTRGKA